MVIQRRRWLPIIAIIGVLAVVAFMQAPPHSQAAMKHASTANKTLLGKLGHVTRMGTVNPATLPKATPKTSQQTAVPIPGVDRPLRSSAQLALYQQFALSHPASLPKAAGVQAPAKIGSPSFLSSNRQVPKLVVSGDGINFTQSGCGCTPPDQAIATNGTQVFEGVNNLLKGYNTSLGTVFGPFTAQAFFGPVFHSGDFFSDPQITYNTSKRRWVIAWLEVQSGGASVPDFIDLAISSTSAINSSYFEYQIPSNVSGSTDFCDYPTMGYENNAEWVSCTTFSTANGSFQGNRLFGFPYKQMLVGAGFPFVFFFNIPTPDQGVGAYRLSPAIEDGTPQGEWVTASDAGFGVTSANITTCAITNTAVISSGSIPHGTCVASAMPLAYDDPLFADQPGSAGSVYPGVGTKQLAYRDGRLWMAMPIAINCGGTVEDGLWWGDVVPQLSPISSGYPQNDAGIVGGFTENAYLCYNGGLSAYMPSINADSEGNAAFSYNVSDSSVHPSLVYTGRMAVDAPGTIGSNGASFFSVIGSTSNNTGRFGDYSACALNPGSSTRGVTWCAGEYGGSDVWNTRILELQSQ